MAIFMVIISVLCTFFISKLDPEERMKKIATLRKPMKIEDLSEAQQKWFSEGKMIKVGKDGYEMFAMVKEPTKKLEAGEEIETVVIVHGFPTSSFDYHRSIDMLLQSTLP